MSSKLKDLDFVKAFCNMCNDGWLQGWHERNGGNLTYRLKNSETKSARLYFYETPGQWVDMGVEDEIFGGEYFLTTGSGKFMRNVLDQPEKNIAIVEINKAGSAYRIVWGLCDGGLPTSEFPTHYLNHAVRVKNSKDKENPPRVIYHAHPANLIAMTAISPWDAKFLTRKFWQVMTECVVIFPDGVGFVDWMVPGGAEIAKATSKQMETYEAVIWALHGMFVSGTDFDVTFGLMHTIEKSAEIYLLARSANGGVDKFDHIIKDNELIAIEKAFGITVNREFLEL